MRVLHTADLHLGKRLYGVDRLDEAAAVLGELARIAADENVDAIVVAGDLLDRRIVDPAVLAVGLRGLERLAQIAPVVAITGNHDEPRLWAELASFVAPHIRVAAVDAVIPVETRSGPLTVACLPWPEPADVVVDPGAMRGVTRDAYSALVRTRLGHLASRTADAQSERGGPSILAAHLMISGGRSGGGERELTLGGTYAVAGGDIPDLFDYVALGHLHKPQDVRSIPSRARYSGSPLGLDFSGDGDRPSVTIVDFTGASPQAREVPVNAGRRLVRIRGTLDQLPQMAAAHPTAWFFCEVISDDTRLDIVRVVRDLVPDALRVEQVSRRLPTEQAVHRDREGEDTRSVVDLYREWRESVGRPADDALVAELEAAIRRADQENDE